MLARMLVPRRSALASGSIALVCGPLALFSACSGNNSASPDAGVDAAGAAESGAQVSTGLPCDVDAVLQTHCRKCHASTPVYGAPMPLVTHADLTAPAKSDPSKKVYELVVQRIRDDAKPMPQPPNARLAAGEMATLDGWVGAGAPRSGDACSGDADAGSQALACTPDLSVAPAAPWTMPQTATNEYVCYGMEVTAGAAKHVVALTPRVDNAKIVHHILLFQTDAAYPSTPQKCSPGGSLQWKLMFGWAPGGKNLQLPPTVGYPLAASGPSHFVVQVHYNNVSGLTGEKDTSGFDLCTAPPRANEADVLAFGTQKIDIPPNASKETTCTLDVPPALAGVHILAAMPHMHQLGTSIETKLVPAGGGPEVDLGTASSWDFNNQSWLPVDATIGANDVVRTKCAWTNTTGARVKFGENTEDEMCYSFSMYYPRIQSSLWTWAAPALISTCK